MAFESNTMLSLSSSTGTWPKGLSFTNSGALCAPFIRSTSISSWGTPIKDNAS